MCSCFPAFVFLRFRVFAFLLFAFWCFRVLQFWGFRLFQFSALRFACFRAFVLLLPPPNTHQNKSKNAMSKQQKKTETLKTNTRTETVTRRGDETGPPDGAARRATMSPRRAEDRRARAGGYPNGTPNITIVRGPLRISSRLCPP